jgi:5-(carboxyamino)imidazole ribonucleotide mutase
LAAAILSTADENLSNKLADYKKGMEDEVVSKVNRLKEEGWKNSFD